ncbi:MAG: trigger factor [Flavobacteriales bacterium]|nr:trigger factor [Flavobacteriales bacterium]
MEIKKEKIDDLNAVIHITVAPEDYQTPVNKVLQDYRKKANLPGFRKGMVPIGMVKKMYGEAIMAEEINKILSNKLYEYISQEKLDILGNPIPSKDEIQLDNLKDGESFNFKYDLGLSPEINFELDDKTKLEYFKIKVDNDLLDKYTKDLARRYGSIKEVTKVGPLDMVNVSIDELDASGEKFEGGIHSHSSISIEYLEKENAKKALVGKGIDDQIVVDPRDYSKNDADLAAMLHVDKSEVDKVGKSFRFTIKKIHELTPSEVNQEMFDKIFGPGEVTTLEEFRKRLGEDLEKTLENDSDKLLIRDLQKKVKEKLKVALPEEFLKRWLILSNKEATPEQIEKDFANFVEGMKWQLIENKIAKDHKVEVTHADALERTKILFKQQMSSYGSEIEDEELTKAAQNYLAKNEDSRQIYEQILDEKMLVLYKEKLGLKTKEVSFDDFVKLATGKAPKKGILESLSNLVKM